MFKRYYWEYYNNSKRRNAFIGKTQNPIKRRCAGEKKKKTSQIQ